MGISSFNREFSVSVAKLADQAQRYDEMAEMMKHVAKSVANLTVDEMILLSEAYRKKIWCRRSFLKILSLNLEKEKSDQLTEYREKVEAEMSDICRDVLSILDQHLIPSCKVGDPISDAFYHRMKVDYSGYLAEFKSGSAKEEAADESSGVFASEELPPAHSVPLDVASNSWKFPESFFCLSPDRKVGYSGYLAEFKSGSAKKETADESSGVFASEEIPPAHSVPLGVASNSWKFPESVFCLSPDTEAAISRQRSFRAMEFLEI